MKRLSTIIIAFLYFLLSVGIAKSTHYCMGRALPTSIFSFESEKCFCEKSSKPDTCCDDELELVKIENDHSFSHIIHTPSPEFNLIGELFSALNESVVIQPEVKFVVESNLPPPKIPIYKVNCSLVFYESVI